MRKWAVVIFIVVIIIAVILGGTFQIILSLLPESQSKTLLPFTLAIGFTVIIANGIIAIMQWFGQSPLDFLPEKTLREKDPKRFRLSQQHDPKLLKEETDKALQLNEYEWAVLFAEAWVKVQPGESRAYEDLGKALIRSNQPARAKEVGKKLISLQKLNHSGYQILGDAYSNLGEWEDARKYFEQALLYASDNFREFVLSDLLDVYEAMGLVDEAINVAQEIIGTISDDYRMLSYQEKLRHLQQIADRQNLKSS